MKHERLISSRASDALAGRPFILSNLYAQAEWDTPLEYARDGDLADLEHMLEQDEAFAAAEAVAMHDPRVRDGDWSLADWVDYTGFARPAESYVPGVIYG